MQHLSWSAVELERVNPLFRRQAIHGDSMTVARIYLDAGCHVPEHTHPNEQLSIIESGELDFVVGGKPVTVKAGESLLIPSGVPHSAHARVAAVSLDVFSGVREDWKSGADAYLRK